MVKKDVQIKDLVDVLEISEDKAEALMKAHDEFLNVVSDMEPQIGITLMLSTATGIASVSGMKLEEYFTLLEHVVSSFCVDMANPPDAMDMLNIRNPVAEA